MALEKAPAPAARIDRERATMVDDLSDIPRHFIEEFRKLGAEHVAWQARTGGLAVPRLAYAVRWLASLDQAARQARQKHDRWMFRLAVATAMLAFVAAVEGGIALALWHG
jgi:hypothetical protein